MPKRFLEATALKRRGGRKMSVPSTLLRELEVCKSPLLLISLFHFFTENKQKKIRIKYSEKN